MKHSPNQILQFLIKESRKGKLFDEVVNYYISELKVPLNEEKQVREQFNDEVENYPNFNFVQKVLSLQYVKDADTNKHYLILANGCWGTLRFDWWLLVAIIYYKRNENGTYKNWKKIRWIVGI